MTTRRATGLGLVLFVTVVVLVGHWCTPIRQRRAEGSSSHGGLLDSQSIIPGQGRAWKDDHLEEYRCGSHCFSLALVNLAALSADTACLLPHCSAGGAQRMLLAKYQSLAQCQWLPGERRLPFARVLSTAV
jgi:hypothetical protein